MKKFSRSLVGRVLGCVLVVSFVLVLFSAYADAGVCENAVLACAADAFIAGLFTQGSALPIFMSLCIVGYDFCTRFVF